MPVDEDGQPLHTADRDGRPRWVLLGRKAQQVLHPFLDRQADAPCVSTWQALADTQAGRKTEV